MPPLLCSGEHPLLPAHPRSFLSRPWLLISPTQSPGKLKKKITKMRLLSPKILTLSASDSNVCCAAAKSKVHAGCSHQPPATSPQTCGSYPPTAPLAAATALLPLTTQVLQRAREPHRLSFPLIFLPRPPHPFQPSPQNQHTLQCCGRHCWTIDLTHLPAALVDGLSPPLS